ncbi:hypothetical protein [Brevibacterium aurantiacum]|uniref:DUF4054 domain-containing protein n=1 Tax=Brevibacterium aurantiacum TaxID=273384 RepID=A0A556C4N4_BREAU|nr:hypothetical protein [Brevibacterium aurantiacum]TSI11968.1 hypothetical protein FO013_21225 [Brevibacterium aurantiacum]
MPVYAEPSDLTNAPDNAISQIRLASSLVDDATLTAFYTVDAEGMPINEDIRARFKAAVVAQVSYWAELGINPALGVAGITSERVATSKSIAGASISYESGERSSLEKSNALTVLGPEAIAVLGYLVRGPVIVRG